MKLEQWAHWAEIVSSIAVVVTLVFLIQQVRGNTEALVRQATLDRVSAVNAPFFSAPELASIVARIKAVDGGQPGPEAFMERYGLTAEEAVLWDRHLNLLWMGIEADFRLQGRTPEVEGWVRSLMDNPDNRLYWQANRGSHGAAFQALVDRVAPEGG